MPDEQDEQPWTAQPGAQVQVGDDRAELLLLEVIAVATADKVPATTRLARIREVVGDAPAADR